MPTTTPVATFTWAIANLERETDDGFVMTAHYTVNANDGTYSSGAYGSIGFERPDSLIPFADLTEELVVGWVKEALGGQEKVDEIEAALQAQLNEQHAPPRLLVCHGLADCRWCTAARHRHPRHDGVAVVPYL
jgi:hypothetical protein